ncbi:hypothetical protein U1Q18_038800 [Sarracenia purpurea var. burkii]
MVVVHASKLNLPQASSSYPPPSSLLFDPHSPSLALMHSDSSFSLYPSLSSFSLPSSTLHPPQSLVHPPTSSATFLRLHHPSPNSPPRVLFIVAAPLHGGAAVLLRFWILLRNSQSFTRAKVICNQTELRFDDNNGGVVFGVNHGASIKLVGAINVFAMYSVSNAKIWVFAVKFAGDDDDGVTLKLMKCSVIDCCVPVFAISVSFGFLILGEENGVRVFPLRPLVKGKVKRHRRESRNLSNELRNDKFVGQRLNLPNGANQTFIGSEVSFGDSVIQVNYGASGRGSKIADGEGILKISSSNGYLEGKGEKQCDSVKLKSVKVRQDSKGDSACFVSFQNKEIDISKPTNKVPLQSAKAISIQALSPDKFLILDSTGKLQLLYLSNSALVSEIPCHMKQLSVTMKVENLVVLHDISTSMQ